MAVRKQGLVTSPAPTPQTIAVPRAGMLATVRNRRGVVAAVEPFDGETGRLHLVHLEYKDERAPAEERILWEIEPDRHLLEPNALPTPAHDGGAMPAEDFDALLRAARWSALSPYLDPAGGEGPPPREPVASPFHGGVCVESYQLVPLLKALRMPRVSLLIADDVGLGKTVEAGLILTELLLRRRIQRVLVLTPASLRRQWQEELWEKFSLRFEVVDRQETERLRRRLGMDANPWRSFSRIVASYHYLRQPDVLEQFLSACRTPALHSHQRGRRGSCEEPQAPQTETPICTRHPPTALLLGPPADRRRVPQPDAVAVEPGEAGVLRSGCRSRGRDGARSGRACGTPGDRRRPGSRAARGPWNPSRLEQRNGRLDRYGQARDVTVHHFVSDTDPDLRFLGHVIRKADEIREDLGSVNEVFDRAVHRRLIQGEDEDAVTTDLDRGIDATRGSAVLEVDATAADAAEEEAREAVSLDAMATEIDLDERALRDTLEAAMAVPHGRPQLRVAEEPGFYRVVRPDLPGWRDVIDESVRRPAPGGAGGGPMPRLAFSPEPFIERLGRLSVFQPRSDALLMHLAHPMMQRAIGVLTRRRYPGGGSEVSRWTVRSGGVPDDADAVVLLSIEELAVNELRETFHRWVRTLALPVRNAEIGIPLDHVPARIRRDAPEVHDPDERERAGEIIDEVSAGLRTWLRAYKDELTKRLALQLGIDGKAARGREDERYRQRQGEVSALIEQSTLARLTREIEQLRERGRQGQLFDETERLADLERSIEEKQEELTRRRHHYEEIRDQLQRERTRILDYLLPARFAMAGSVQTFPVALEIRLPE